MTSPPAAGVDPMAPSPRLLCKLGSLIVHLDEHRCTGHNFDEIAALSLLDDKEVEAWLTEMTKLGFLPVKR